MARIAVPRWILYALVLALGMSLAFIAGSLQQARGDNHDTTYYACLYAGSLSQVGTTEPTNCGRGTAINWNTAAPEGITGYFRVDSDPIVVVSGTSGGEAVPCPDGTSVLGGGVRWTESGGIADSQVVRVESSGPLSNSWSARIRNDGPASNTFVVSVFCATVAPD